MKEHTFLHLLMPKHWTGTFFPGKSDFVDFTTHLLCYFASTILQSPRDHSFNPETRMKAVCICFIYAIHIFIVCSLIKRFLEKSRNFIVNIIMIMLIVF